MIICQSCGRNQPSGAIFCDECGAKLLDTSGLATQSIGREGQFGEVITASEEKQLDVDKAGIIGVVKLVVLKTGAEIRLTGQDEFTLGRISDGQSIIPDIDLSNFNAYQEGVSRIHASIKLAQDKVNLMDLVSVNGVMINDTKIPPGIYHPLSDGDFVSLGRLKLQVVMEK